MSILCDNCGKSARLHSCYGEGNLDAHYHPSEKRERRGEIAIAIEYGYRACEKGQSLQQTLEICAESDELQKVFWTPEALRANIQPRPVQPPRVPFCPIPCPNCGKAESVNWNCSNHIILNGEIYGNR